MIQCIHSVKKEGVKVHFLGRLINILNTSMQTPTMYGWFHLLFWALSIGGAVALCVCFKSPSEKTVRKIIFIFAAVSIVLEIYKQFNYTFSYDGTKISADYQWYAFPFQFCSTPMYVALLAALIKNKKIHSAMCSYLATFSLFAGICVMIYPVQVFIDTIGINIQTMICHGSMITIGVWLIYCEYIEYEHKTILGGISIFAILVVAASIMNRIAFATGLLERETFNMFYISPHCDPSLPVYSAVQNAIAFPWCLIIYVAAFSLAAYFILLFAITIKKAVSKRKTDKKTTITV